MTATKITPAVYERLVDRLRHCEQYAEAARLMAEEALSLLEAAKGKEVNNNGA